MDSPADPCVHSSRIAPLHQKNLREDPMLHSLVRLVSIASLTAASLVTTSLVGTAEAANSQQDKMKTCNLQAKAKNLAGDQRKGFMKSCLSATDTSTASTITPQQQKMKSCNADAKTKGLAGDDRKTFMKTCLSAPH